ncbi:MAG: triose-phosphate isomerase [Planctomycetes bacterium]|nr:triose-phosphate isomerase [Planctomycetota bacterium]
MTVRRPLIAGNWKMHNTLADARQLVSALLEGIDRVKGVDVLICPSFTNLFPMAKSIAGTRIMMGAQNVHEAEKGAFTGEISAAMIKDTGCTHVIVGHSERRHVFGETSDRLGKKVRAVVDAGLIAIYCVGETLDDRDSGRTYDIVDRQLGDVLGEGVDPERVVVAYEPVWAIGTGVNATPEQAQEVHEFIRGRLGDIYDPKTASATRILYGGSVKPANAAGLLSEADIDGALVGGACLVAEDFLAIISAAAARVVA